MPQRNLSPDIAESTLWGAKLVTSIITVAVGAAFSVGVSYSVINLKQENSDAKAVISEIRLTKIEDDRESMKRDYFERMTRMETSVKSIDANVERILKKLDQ